MFQVNSSLFICIICILVAPPDSKWFKPWFYSSCPLSWCMRVAKQFFDSPGSWLASNLCSSRPRTSGIVWLDVPHHSQDEKAGNPEGPQIRLMEKRWKEGRSLWWSHRISQLPRCYFLCCMHVLGDDNMALCKMHEAREGPAGQTLCCHHEEWHDHEQLVEPCPVSASKIVVWGAASACMCSTKVLQATADRWREGWAQGCCKEA